MIWAEFGRSPPKLEAVRPLSRAVQPLSHVTAVVGIGNDTTAYP